jgi:hypothetical protein
MGIEKGILIFQMPFVTNREQGTPGHDLEKREPALSRDNRKSFAGKSHASKRMKVVIRFNPTGQRTSSSEGCPARDA